MVAADRALERDDDDVEGCLAGVDPNIALNIAGAYVLSTWSFERPRNITIRRNGKSSDWPAQQYVVSTWCYEIFMDWKNA